MATVSPYDPGRLARLGAVQTRSLHRSPAGGATTTATPVAAVPFVARPLLSTTAIPAAVSNPLPPNANLDAAAAAAAMAANNTNTINADGTPNTVAPVSSDSTRPATGGASRLAASSSAPVLHPSKDAIAAAQTGAPLSLPGAPPGFSRHRRNSSVADAEGLKAQRLKSALTTFLLTGRDPEEEARIAAEEQAKAAAAAAAPVVPVNPFQMKNPNDDYVFPEPKKPAKPVKAKKAPTTADDGGNGNGTGRNGMSSSSSAANLTNRSSSPNKKLSSSASTSRLPSTTRSPRSNRGTAPTPQSPQTGTGRRLASSPSPTANKTPAPAKSPSSSSSATGIPLTVHWPNGIPGATGTPNPLIAPASPSTATPAAAPSSMVESFDGRRSRGMTEEKLLARIPGQLVNSYRHIQNLHNNLRTKQDRDKDRKGFASSAQRTADYAIRRDMPPGSSTPFSLEKDYAVLLDHHLQALARRSNLHSPPGSSHGNRPTNIASSPTASPTAAVTASPSASAMVASGASTISIAAFPANGAATPTRARSPRHTMGPTLSPPAGEYGIPFEETKDREWNHHTPVTPVRDNIIVATVRTNSPSPSPSARARSRLTNPTMSTNRMKTPPRSARRNTAPPKSPPSPIPVEIDIDEKEIDGARGVLQRPPPLLDHAERRTLFPTIETRLVANLFPDVFNKINDGNDKKNGDHEAGQMPLHLKRQPQLVPTPNAPWAGAPWKYRGVPPLYADAKKDLFLKDWSFIRFNDVVPKRSDRDEVKKVLWGYYDEIRWVFQLFSSQDMSLGSMGVNEFTQFCRTCHLIDKTVSAGAVYQIFVRVNVEEEYDPDDTTAGEDGAVVSATGQVMKSSVPDAKRAASAKSNKGGDGKDDSENKGSRPGTGAISTISNGVPKLADPTVDGGDDIEDHKGPKRRRRQRAHLTIVDDPNNPDSRFLRGEFMEALTRLAMLKYKHKERGAAAQLLRMLKKHVLHYGVDRYLRNFQKRLDSDKLEPTWDKYTARLYDIFLSYAALNKTVAETGQAHLGKDQWNWLCYQTFLKDHELIDGNLSRRVASVSYGLSADENLLREWQGTIQPVIGYPSFLQLIARLALAKFEGVKPSEVKEWKQKQEAKKEALKKGAATAGGAASPPKQKATRSVASIIGGLGPKAAKLSLQERLDILCSRLVKRFDARGRPKQLTAEQPPAVPVSPLGSPIPPATLPNGAINPAVSPYLTGTPTLTGKSTIIGTTGPAAKGNNHNSAMPPSFANGDDDDDDDPDDDEDHDDPERDEKEQQAAAAAAGTSGAEPEPDGDDDDDQDEPQE